MSLVFALAADLHREIQAAYRTRIENDFRAADDACHGYLLNKIGKTLARTRGALGNAWPALPARV